MKWLYDIRIIVDKYPILWLALFVLLYVIIALVVYASTKKLKKSALITAVISAIITACIAGIFNLCLGSPVIKNDASVIPSDLNRIKYKIDLLDYYGDYYYPPNSKDTYFIYGDLTVQASRLSLINKDYNVEFNSYKVNQDENGSYEYEFNDIPIGNYTLTMEVPGYKKHVEEIMLGYGEPSVNYITGKKWWHICPIMKKNDDELTYAMNVWFLDSKQNPVSDLKYEFINTQNALYTHYSYPKSTDSEGSIDENIRIKDDKSFLIAYINPYTHENEVICVTSKVDKSANKCDAILMFDNNGVLKQTSPKELWN